MFELKLVENWNNNWSSMTGTLGILYINMFKIKSEIVLKIGR